MRYPELEELRRIEDILKRNDAKSVRIEVQEEASPFGDLLSFRYLRIQVEPGDLPALRNAQAQLDTEARMHGFREVRLVA